MANNWTREQLIIAFNLYCKLPFAKAVKTNSDVIRTADLIGRTPSAVAFKLGNFGSFDPELKKRGIGGLPNTSKLDKAVWDEFHGNWEELAFQSEKLIAEFSNTSLESSERSAVENLPLGRERETIVRVRVNQSFFRSSVLAIYGGRCCITGFDLEPLLVASHIVPWRLAGKDRTNPQNGLCLNALHDRAFDRGLITITPKYEVRVSSAFKKIDCKPEFQKFFDTLDGQRIDLPDKFLPSEDFLRYHNESIFQQ